MQMAAKYEGLGLRVIAITEASVADAMRFVVEHGAPFPVLAEAREVREAFRIELIWGSPMFLIDRAGIVVAEERASVEHFLGSLFDERSDP